MHRHSQKIWPRILLVIILWLTLFWLIFYNSPDKNYELRIMNYEFVIPLTKVAFFLNLLLALTLTLGLILKSTKKAFSLSLGVTLFLLLKMLQLVNWLNILLLITLTAILFLA